MRRVSNVKHAETMDDDIRENVRVALYYMDRAIVDMANKYVPVLEHAGINVGGINNGLQMLKTYIVMIAQENDLLASE